MPGYIDNPEANSDSFFDGDWFRTGDLGFITFEMYQNGNGQVSNGHMNGKSGWVHPSSMSAGPWLTLTGRKKELINRGGEKVSPAEVEAVALSDGSVGTAVCFPMPDEVYGEQVALVLVPLGKKGEYDYTYSCLRKTPAGIF